MKIVLCMGDKRNTQKTLKVSLKEGGILKYPGIGEKNINLDLKGIRL